MSVSAVYRRANRASEIVNRADHDQMVRMVNLHRAHGGFVRARLPR